MSLTIRTILLGITLLFTYIPSAFAETALTKVKLQTNMGDIILELNDQKAPKTVANFVEYVNSGFYDGTIFHRVISNFMIQGGGFTENFKKKKTRPEIANEANNRLKNTRGTVAMARTSDPHSATGQFFVNVVDNSFLDFRAQTTRGWGYAVFGKVVSGMDVVDKIRKLRTGPGGSFGKDVPHTAVIIEKASLVTAE